MTRTTKKRRMKKAWNKVSGLILVIATLVAICFVTYFLGSFGVKVAGTQIRMAHYHSEIKDLESSREYYQDLANKAEISEQIKAYQAQADNADQNIQKEFEARKALHDSSDPVIAFAAKNDFEFLNSFIHGGKQEYGLRAGTENVSGIVGLGKAIELLDNGTIREVRDYCLDRLKDIKGIKLNGTKDLSKRLDCNINIRIKGVENESLINMLSLYGIYVSSGSACNSGSLAPSHVLKAIGLSDKEANSSIRITIGEETTKEDIDYFIDKLKISLDKIK